MHTLWLASTVTEWFSLGTHGTISLRLQPNAATASKLMQGRMEPEKRAELVEQGKALKDRLAQLDEELAAARDAMQREGQRLPNLAHPQVSC